MDKSRSQLLFDVGPAKELSSKILISTVYLLSKEINFTSFLFVSPLFSGKSRSPLADQMSWYGILGVSVYF